MFASGIIINGFTPSSDRATESLVEAIKQFKVDIVCVIDFESLVEDLRTLLKANPDIVIIDTPKSNGVKAVKYDEKIL
jgi:predicted metallo-beta-lactamase superfamily hydrolase